MNDLVSSLLAVSLVLSGGCAETAADAAPPLEGGGKADNPLDQTGRLAGAVAAFKDAAWAVADCYDGGTTLPSSFDPETMECGGATESLEAEIHHFLLEENVEQSVGTVVFRPVGEQRCSFVMWVDRVDHGADTFGGSTNISTTVETDSLRCLDASIQTPAELAARYAKDIGEGIVHCLEKEGGLPDSTGACPNETTVFDHLNANPSVRTEVVAFETALDPTSAAIVSPVRERHPLRHVVLAVDFTRETTGDHCSLVAQWRSDEEAADHIEIATPLSCD